MPGVAQTLHTGVLGLGIMGSAMARNLLQAGFPLTVSGLSRGPVSELVAGGAEAVATVGGVTAASDVLLVNVPDTADLEELVGGSDGILSGAHPGLVVVAMGTYDPSAMPPIARRFAARDAHFLDAPVSGGDIGARDATLSIMVGGEAAALAQAMPVLEALGRTITHIGPSGAGQVAKACNQLVVGSTIQAVAEAFVLARTSGVDPARVLGALMGGLAGSVVLERHRRRMLEGDFTPGARSRLHAKDARIVMAAARQAGITLPGFTPVAAAFETLVETGAGDLDHSALVTLLDGWREPPASPSVPAGDVGRDTPERGEQLVGAEDALELGPQRAVVVHDEQPRWLRDAPRGRPGREIGRSVDGWRHQDPVPAVRHERLGVDHPQAREGPRDGACLAERGATGAVDPRAEGIDDEREGVLRFQRIADRGQVELLQWFGVRGDGRRDRSRSSRSSACRRARRAGPAAGCRRPRGPGSARRRSGSVRRSPVR